MDAPRSVSVLLPVLNGATFLPRVLEGLAGQVTDLDWEFLAIDCGSTDGTLDILADFAARFPVPLRVHGLHKSEFNHGDTRNLLGALTDKDLLLFITDDAIPVGADWLNTIVRNFEDPKVAACYVRNVPRPEVGPVTRALSDGDPGYAAGRIVATQPTPDAFEALEPHERRYLWNYNDTASCVRRVLWERFPYPHLDFGEDVLLARGLLEAGWKIVYEDGAVIHHSHEYDAATTRARSADDAHFNALWLDRPSIVDDAALEIGVERSGVADRAFFVSEGLSGAALDAALVEASELRRAYFLGQQDGSGVRRRLPMPTMTDDPRPNVAVSGVPRAAVQGLRERGWKAGGDPDRARVLHVHGDDDDAELLVTDNLDADMCVLWTVSRAWAEAHGMRKRVLASWELDDPKKIDRPPFSERWGERGLGIPFELAIWDTDVDLDALRGEGRGQVLTIPEERVRWLEVRYRGLLARQNVRRPEVALDVRGTDRIGQAGAVRALDHCRLLLDPGGRADYDLCGVPGGAYRLKIITEALAEEAEVLLGGTVQVDGQDVGTIGPLRSCGGDEVRVQVLDLKLTRDATVLTLLGTTADEGPTTLRIVRVLLLDPCLEAPLQSTLEGSLDLRGVDGELRGRKTSVQGADMVLLGPKRSRWSWPVQGLRPGLYEVVFWLSFTAEEGALEQHGRFLFDGKPVARFGPVTSPPGGGAVQVPIAIRISEPGQVLQLRNTKRPGGRPGFARIQRVRFRPIPGPDPKPIGPLRTLTRIPPRLRL